MKALSGSVLFILLAVLPALAMALSPAELAQIKATIAAQYDAVDDTMLSYAYRTHIIIERPEHPTRTQLTDFDPQRPSGSKEQLLLVDQAPPEDSDLAEFNRRPQPDERETQRIRLLIDYDSLEPVTISDSAITFSFQPRLLVNGREDRDGRRFRGELTFDRRQQHLRQVRMHNTEAFTKLLFRVRGFEVDEHFVLAEGNLIRERYFHDMDLSNPLIDASNRISMTFAYPEPLQLGLYPDLYQQHDLVN